MQINHLLWIGFGGFLGANARYLLSAWVTARVVTLFGLSIPYGTLLVNVLGSFLLALFGAWLMARATVPDSVRLFVATGFFGAFTTFSTYANEAITLGRSGAWTQAVSYVLLTNGLCLLGVLAGLWIARGVFLHA
ncbi:MAG: fluoride efflux transporter CrcB [Anaerolineae bacterium]